MGTQEMEQKKIGVVQWGDLEYELVDELTQREIFEAESITGKAINDTPRATGQFMIAWFTLKRNGVDLTWDEFLDANKAKLVEKSVLPLDEPLVSSESGDGTIGADGTQPGPTSSD